MKDTHIALIGGVASWIVLVGGGLGVPAALIGAEKAAHERTINSRGMTAEVPAQIGDIASFKVPKGFKADPLDDAAPTPETHEDPDAITRVWQLGARKRQPWQFPRIEDEAEPAGVLMITVADPLANAAELQRMDFEAGPFSTVGPVEVLKRAYHTMADADSPTGAHYLAQNLPAGLSAQLYLTDPKLYTDEQARDLLVSVLGSMQVRPAKLEALLAGPRARQEEERIARENLRADAIARLTDQLNLKPGQDGVLVSAAGDVLADGVLYMRLDTRKVPPGAKPGEAAFQLVAPATPDMLSMYGDEDELSLALLAIGPDGEGGFVSTPVVSADYAKANGFEVFGPEPFPTDWQFATKYKPTEVTLVRTLYLDDVADSDGLTRLGDIVSQTMEWRAAKEKIWAPRDGAK